MNTQLVKESLAIVDMAFLEPDCEEDEKYTLLEAKLLQFAKTTSIDLSVKFSLLIAARDLLCTNPELIPKFFREININEYYCNHTEACTILHKAIIADELDLIHHLLNNGAKVNMIRFAQYINAKTAASTQFSEILLVIITESWQHSIIVDLVNLLIQHGADVNIPQKTICSNNFGEMHFTYHCTPPLHYAVTQENHKLVQALVLAGADIYQNKKIINSFIGESEESVWDYRISEEMKKSLLTYWTPEQHKYTSVPIKKAILSILIIAKREHWNFDNTILYHIFTYVAYCWKIVK